RWLTGSWLFDKEKAGLIPFDLHIHDLDVIVSLFGQPESFDFMSSQGVSDFPEHFRFIYKYSNTNVVAEAAWFNAEIPFTARWRVYFEKGYVVNDGETLVAYPDQGDPIVYDVEEKIKIETGINVPPTGMYYAELKHFINCIENEKPSSRVTAEQVVTVLEILEDVSKNS
ncbi:MAG TPA: Gfo/Idh/MocA family oxidoreductase, partial [Erysipelothrix sp.]|nr:Gfo/Idh/MocA family oxidoreductase [Erysipelothrix sp.]